MKNKTLITALENLDRDLSVSIKAYLQNGAVEKVMGMANLMASLLAKIIK